MCLQTGWHLNRGKWLVGKSQDTRRCVGQVTQIQFAFKFAKCEFLKPEVFLSRPENKCWRFAASRGEDQCRERIGDCQKAFKACKEAFTNYLLLVHYDLNRTLRLACDASSYGLGAVLSHVMEDSQERQIAYVSSTLRSTEKNYAQIEWEALSIIFGVKKFYQFLYGRKFTLVTDHQPLLTILGPKATIPPLAAARMQCLAIVFSAYNYQIQYRSSAKHSNCDALSRLPHEDS